MFVKTCSGDLAITEVYCNTLQHTATHCNTLQHTATWVVRGGRFTRARTATHCNALQHTTTQCNTLHEGMFRRFRRDLDRETLQHTATSQQFGLGRERLRTPIAKAHCNTLQHTVARCNIEHTTPHCNSVQRTATHCNMAQTLSYGLGRERLGTERQKHTATL